MALSSVIYHRGDVRALAVRDGAHPVIVVATGDELRVYRLTDLGGSFAMDLAQCRRHSGVSHLCFSPRGDYLAVFAGGSKEFTVEVMPVGDDSILLDFPRPVGRARFSGFVADPFISDHELVLRHPSGMIQALSVTDEGHMAESLVLDGLGTEQPFVLEGNEGFSVLRLNETGCFALSYIESCQNMECSPRHVATIVCFSRHVAVSVTKKFLNHPVTSVRSCNSPGGALNAFVYTGVTSRQPPTRHEFDVDSRLPFMCPLSNRLGAIRCITKIAVAASELGRLRVTYLGTDCHNFGTEASRTDRIAAGTPMNTRAIDALAESTKSLHWPDFDVFTDPIDRKIGMFLKSPYIKTKNGSTNEPVDGDYSCPSERITASQSVPCMEGTTSLFASPSGRVLVQLSPRVLVLYQREDGEREPCSFTDDRLWRQLDEGEPDNRLLPPYVSITGTIEYSILHPAVVVRRLPPAPSAPPAAEEPHRPPPLETPPPSYDSLDPELLGEDQIDGPSGRVEVHRDEARPSDAATSLEETVDSPRSSLPPGFSANSPDERLATKSASPCKSKTKRRLNGAPPGIASDDEDYVPPRRAVAQGEEDPAPSRYSTRKVVNSLVGKKKARP